MKHGKLYDSLGNKKKADEIFSLFGTLSEQDKKTTINILMSFNAPTDGKGNNEMDITL